MVFREGTVRVDADGNLLSLAVISEGFYCALLNTLKGWNLINANSEEKNAPGIDLIDKNQKIAVQVSLTCDHEKVQCSIDKFKAESYDGWHFYFVPIKRDTTCFRKDFALPEGMIFHKDEDVLSISRILRIVQQELDIDKKRKLSNLMDKYTKELTTHEALCKRLYDRLREVRDRHPSFLLMGEDGIDKHLFPHTDEIIPALGDLEGNVAPIWEHIKAEQKENFRHVIIEGDGGIGKSVSLLSVTEDNSLLTHIPAIYIHMYDLVYGGQCLTLPEFLAHNADHDEIDRLCSEGGEPKLLLLLDGFNELSYEHQGVILCSVQHWASGHRGAQLIIASRPIPGRNLERILDNGVLHRAVLHIKLTGLEKEQCKERLSAWNIPLPNDGAEIWETLKLPLFLTLYAKTARLPTKTQEDYPLDVREVTGPASLIWNYLQRELLREEKAEWPVCCAIACEYIAPYIAYQMAAIKHTFELDHDEAEQLVEEAVEKIDMAVLPTHLQNVNKKRRHDRNKLPEADWVSFVLEQSGIFVASKGGTKEEKPCDNGESEAAGDGYAFMHQNFRDCLAGLYLVNLAEMEKKNQLPEFWKHSQSHLVLDYAAELMGEETAKNLWEANRLAQQYNNDLGKPNHSATYNLLELMKRRNFPKMRLDFSGMDLRGLSLTRYLGQEDTDLKLFRSATLAKDTFLDRMTFQSDGHIGAVNCIAALPDGRVVSGSEDSTLRVWDPTTGQCLQTLKGHLRAVKCVAVFSDGKRVVSGSEDHTLRVWDAATGDCLQTLKGHTGCVSSIAVLKDGRVVSGADSILQNDSTIRVWDAATGDCLQALKGHSGSISCIDVLPDGRIVSGSSDGTVRVWDLSDESKSIVLKPDIWYHHRGPVVCIAVFPDGRVVSGSWYDIWDEEVLRVWEVNSDKKPLNLETRQYDRTFFPVRSVAILPDGRVVGPPSGFTLGVWDTGEGKLQQTLNTGSITCFVILPDGRIVSGSASSSEYTLRVCETTNGDCLRKLEGHTDKVSCIAVLSDGRVVSGSMDGTLRVWDIETGKCLQLMGRHKPKCIKRIIFRSNGNILSISDKKMYGFTIYDTEIRLWDSNSGECLEVLEGCLNDYDESLNIYNEIVFNLSDGQMLSISYEKIKLWDVVTERVEIDNNFDHHLPDGRKLSWSINSNNVDVEDSDHCLQTLAHPARVSFVSVFPDGRVITGSDDGIMRIWNPDTGECLDTLEVTEIDVSQMDFSEANMDDNIAKLLWRNHAKVPPKAKNRLELRSL